MVSLRSICGTVAFAVSAMMLVVAGQAAARGYGAAGCGLGSSVIGPTPGFSQVFASTTNGTSASQTFGITSGTSNCDWEPNSQARAFIEGNREAFVKEMARGRGETIVALTTIAGCVDASQVGNRLQREFRRLVPDVSTSDAKVSERVIELLRNDANLACMDLS